MNVLTPAPSQDILQWDDILATWHAEERGKIETKTKMTVFKPYKPCISWESLLNWATALDEICRVAFPLTFFVLIIAYYVVFVVLH